MGDSFSFPRRDRYGEGDPIVDANGVEDCDGADEAEDRVPDAGRKKNRPRARER